MAGERLIYLPLGGAGEIGMNAYIYGYGRPGKERLLLVDLGVAFPDMDSSPGVDVIVPDLGWLIKNVDRLDGIVITHAHEDHIGALAHLWPMLKKPIYARKFTAAIGRLKFEEAGLPKDAITTVEARPAKTEVGPFTVQFLPVSHSIPESAMIIIDTPAGRIVHSADFKRDATPIVGEAWDEALMTEVAAEKPVKVFACDSTNVFSTHEGRSEATLAAPLTELIKGASGMVVATTFASNVARLKTLAEAATAANRTVCLLGRAMRRMVSVAQETGVLKDFPRSVSPEEAADMPRKNLMLLVTGSQGERRAASAALSRGKYLGIELREGDTFLFSSKVIPGNERGVSKVVNALSEKGLQIIDEHDGKYHVSGHANRPDLEHAHRTFLPDMVIPMHGEHRHLREHVKVAHEAGIASIVVANGSMADLTGDVPVIVERIETGRVYLDGSALVGAQDGVVRDRLRLAMNGLVIVTMIVDEQDSLMGEAWVETLGLADQGRSRRSLIDTLETDLTQFLEGAGGKIMSDDKKLDDAVKRIVRQVCVEEIGKKPEVVSVVSRLALD
jgi:ribonuclease J